jgi:hypothetical protein
MEATIERLLRMGSKEKGFLMNRDVVLRNLLKMYNLQASDTIFKTAIVTFEGAFYFICLKYI